MREKIDPMNMTAWEEWRIMVRLGHREHWKGVPKTPTAVICPAWRKSFNNFLWDMGRPPRGKHLKRHAEVEFNKENCYWG